MLTWLLLRPVGILRALAEVGWFRRKSLSDRTGWNHHAQVLIFGIGTR